ncbi:hypothetical protein [Actinoplanes palleronii]|uniref:Uncharacterized protein n=2 Tax=Actinoplanes palleronii TaxID=113570 RepID=A0ABQ4B1F4_9ACTN|nr:hypothetical protein [Actinoplanes palleronii]GIE64494.1 hypothetical protein Apa02nite_006020 [Actinoplanes palleronii]
MADYDAWLDAYSAAYDTVPGPLLMPCPHCAHQCLQVVFTGDLDSMIGYAHFWCDHCLQGIGVSRTTIPEGAVVQDIRQPRADRQPKIPNFRLVQ